jgi:hypothetical protein
MRFEIASPERARRLAKSLSKHLASHGFKIPLNKAQEALARILGHADWREMTSRIGRHPPSELAEEMSHAEAARQSAALSLFLGLPQSKADSVIAEVRPTCRTTPLDDMAIMPPWEAETPSPDCWKMAATFSSKTTGPCA